MNMKLLTIILPVAFHISAAHGAQPLIPEGAKAFGGIGVKPPASCIMSNPNYFDPLLFSRPQERYSMEQLTRAGWNGLFCDASTLTTGYFTNSGEKGVALQTMASGSNGAALTAQHTFGTTVSLALGSSEDAALIAENLPNKSIAKLAGSYAVAGENDSGTWGVIAGRRLSQQVGVWGGVRNWHDTGVVGSNVETEAEGRLGFGDVGVYGVSHEGPAIHADGDLLVENDTRIQGGLNVRWDTSIGGNLSAGYVNAESGASIGGDLHVRGALRGDIAPQGGSPFPRPAFNSRWTTIAKDEAITLTHNVGGQTDNYFVDIQCRSERNSIHNLSFISHPQSKRGVSFSKLSNADVNIHRRANDEFCHEVRFRIWVIV